MTEAVYAHPTPIETKEGSLTVVIRVDWTTHLVKGARLTLIDHDESMVVSTAFFWALLDEDAQMIYDEMLKHFSIQ